MTSHIYHGPWINFGNGGYITGATVTLSDRSGGLLTSFIATFVTLVGAQLWKILAFAIHQIRSTTEPEDALFHQQQTIWRNTTNPGGTSWTFLQQAWYCMSYSILFFSHYHCCLSVSGVALFHFQSIPPIRVPCKYPSMS